MKKIIEIFIVVVLIFIIITGINVYSIYHYETQKQEWRIILDDNRKSFDYVVEYLRDYSDLDGSIVITLSNDISFIYDNPYGETVNIPENVDLIKALTKIKECGIDMIYRNGALGWNFCRSIKYESDITIDEIGIYTNDFLNNECLNHIDDNWFFRNTTYNLEEEKVFYRKIYDLLFKLVFAHDNKANIMI